MLWADRFKSILIEGGEALAAVAAYIELNRVLADLCADPNDYRYCGYAEALAKGSSLARQGIRIVLGQSDAISWKEVSRQHRKYLFVHGSLNSKTKRPAFDLATAQTVVDKQNGELSLPERLRCRIRYFADGVILGSQAFVESHFYNLQRKLGYRRRRPATRLVALGPAEARAIIPIAPNSTAIPKTTHAHTWEDAPARRSRDLPSSMTHTRMRSIPIRANRHTPPRSEWVKTDYSIVEC